MRAFALRPESDIPLTVQLREQIRYQIRSGLLRPGDPLPSLRDLAAGLGLNRNTVIRALASLAEEGLVEAEHGRGHYVAPEAPVVGPRLRAAASAALAQAREMGVGPEEMAMAVLAQSQIASPGAPVRRALLLVGHPGDGARLRAALEAALPLAVTPVLAHDPLPCDTSSAEVVLATLFHTPAAHPLAGPRPAIPLAPPSSQAEWERLGTLPPETPVAVLGRDWVEAGRIRQSLALAAPELQEVRVLTPGPGLAEALRPVRLVLCPHALQGVVQPHIPPEAALLAEPLGPDPAVVAAIAEALGTPPHSRRVSPWF